MIQMLYKKLLVGCGLLAFCSFAWAGFYTNAAENSIYSSGPYVTGKFGYSKVSIDGYNSFTDFLKTQGKLKDKHHWVGSSIIIGWSFWRFLSLEAGYIDYPEKEYSVDIVDKYGDTSQYDFDYETKAWDVVTKLALPLGVVASFLDHWDLYVKGGVAYVSGSFTNTLDDNSINSPSASAWLPIYEAGIDYNFNEYLAFEFSWTRFEGKNSVKYELKNGLIQIDDNDAIPKTNLYAVGVSFKLANLL